MRNLQALAICLGLSATTICATCLGGAPDLPDSSLTPGVARTDLTLEQICATKWGHDERAVTEKMKRQVMQEYASTQCPSGKIEIDHLWSRELGGADDVKNLWAQCYEKPIADPAHPGKSLPPSVVAEMGAHKKDRLENELGKRVCLPATDPHRLTLDQARAMLSDNWIASYIALFGDPRAQASNPQ